MSRSVRVFSALLAPAVTVPVLAQAGSAVDVPAPPSNPGLPGALDIASSYHPQTVCDPAAKPGVTAFARLMSRHYAEPNYGISRNCNSGLTEHSEGRALDWMLDINNAQERAVANSVVAWLVAPDSQGRPGAMARRFGIMYIIWNRQIWGAYSMDKGWRAYSGASPHTDHIHFSFSWDGALQKTSWWTGKALTSETTSPGSGAGPITVPTSYTTLQQGDHGTDVMLVQRAVGVSADGVFGPATAAAVRAWQSRHGLPASGTVTAAMWDKLIAQGKAPSRDTSTTTPDAPSGVLADYFSQTLRLGSTGAAVEALQKALGITVDGVFGEQTAAAVSAFQKSKKLGIDGVVGPNTWRALDGSVVADKDKDTADKDKDKDDKGKDSDSGSGADLGRWSSTVLAQGARSEAVRAVQKALGIEVDGVFGSGTAAAVRAFQEEKKLWVDGVVGPSTWKALSGSAGSSGSGSSDKDKDDKGKDSDSGSGADLGRWSSTVLAQGARSEAVRAVQKALGIEVDGVFGSGTAAAVRAFQEEKKLWVDGVVGPSTWKALSGSAGSSGSGSSDKDKYEKDKDAGSGSGADLGRWSSTVLAQGARSEAVRAVQKALGIEVDGVFGSKTAAAVRAFQEEKKLWVDGVVGPSTWKALSGSAGSSTAASRSAGRTGAPGVSTVSSTTDLSRWKSTVLAKGSRGASVKALQRALGGLAVDGVYGSATEQAVKRFQQMHDLKVTGVADERTWDELESAAHPLLAYRSTVLREGSTGPAVRMLQRSLGITADGVFGPATQSAVRALQQRHHLSRNGVVGSLTWQALERDQVKRAG